MFRSGIRICVLIGLVALLVVFFQGSSGVGAWGGYLLMLTLACGLFLYFLSEEGKRRSQNETELLMTFMDDALGSDLFLPLERKKAARLYRRMA